MSSARARFTGWCCRRFFSPVHASHTFVVVCYYDFSDQAVWTSNYDLYKLFQDVRVCSTALVPLPVDRKRALFLCWEWRVKSVLNFDSEFIRVFTLSCVGNNIHIAGRSVCLF